MTRRAPDIDTGLLRAFADVAAFAQRGLGTDVDPDPGDVMIGLAGTGFQGDIAIGAENALLAGSSVNAAVMVGVNLARWGHPRWTVFANGFYLATTVRALDGDLGGVDLHLRLQDAAISGDLEVGEAQHFIQGAAEHRRDGFSFSSQLSYFSQF